MANKVGARTVSDAPANIRILNYDTSKLFNPEISRGQEITAKLLRLYSALKKSSPTKDIKFKVLEDTYLKRQIPIATLPAGATGTTFTVTADNSKLIRANTQLYNPTTNERMLVTAVNYGSGLVTVTRDYGTVLGGASASTAVTQNLIIGIGADAENAGSPDPISNAPEDSYNYISNVRTSFGMSEHEKNTEHEVIKDPWAHEADKARVQHLEKLEHTIWFSARGTGTDSSGNAYTTTGGVMQHIERVLDISGGTYGGILTERLMDYIMELIFVNGNTVKDGFCGRHFVTALGGFAKNRLIINDQMTKKLGMAIAEYTHGGNTLRLVVHPKIFVGTGAVTGVTGGTMASKLVVLDMEQIELVHMQNMDTQLAQDIGARDNWGRKDEWRSTIGVRMHPGLDNTYNASSGVPEQYESPHLVVSGFDTY